MDCSQCQRLGFVCFKCQINKQGYVFLSKSSVNKVQISNQIQYINKINNSNEVKGKQQIKQEKKGGEVKNKKRKVYMFEDFQQQEMSKIKQMEQEKEKELGQSFYEFINQIEQKQTLLINSQQTKPKKAILSDPIQTIPSIYTIPFKKTIKPNNIINDNFLQLNKCNNKNIYVPNHHKIQKNIRKNYNGISTGAQRIMPQQSRKIQKQIPITHCTKCDQPLAFKYGLLCQYHLEKQNRYTNAYQ